MKIKPLRNDLILFLRKHQIEKKFEKQKILFESDNFHRSLNTELLEPKHLRIYSFRIDLQYRAIFIIINNEAEITSINKHYR